MSCGEKKGRSCSKIRSVTIFWNDKAVVLHIGLFESSKISSTHFNFPVTMICTDAGASVNLQFYNDIGCGVVDTQVDMYYSRASRWARFSSLAEVTLCQRCHRLRGTSPQLRCPRFAPHHAGIQHHSRSRDSLRQVRQANGSEPDFCIHCKSRRID